MSFRDDTGFAIAGIDLPSACARGVKQTITPIDNGRMLRMLSGTLRDLTRPSARKFRSTVTLSDIWEPPFSPLHRGRTVVIDSVVEFVEPVSEPQARPAVDGTLYYIDAASQVVAAGAATHRVYRPRLTCLVTGWEIDRDEWAQTSNATLELEEV